jgi:hypothetical protein
MRERKKYLKIFGILRDRNEQFVDLEEILPDEKKKDETVEIPLLDAFVQGFQMAFQIK